MVLLWLLDSLDLRGFLLFLLVFLITADYLWNKNPPNYPPGPLALPLLGNIFSIDSNQPHVNLTKMADVYGKVFSLRIGRDKVVLVAGYKLVKETLVTQAENFVARPYSSVSDRVYSGNGGLFFSNGNMWRKQRRFTLSTLRTFGLGKKTMELAICEECRVLLDEMDRQKGEPFDPTKLFNNAVSNIICQLVFGRRFSYSDHDFQKMLQYLTESVYLEGSIWAQLYEAFPVIMKHVPGPHNKIFSNYKAVCDFIKADLEKHKEQLNPSEPRDYIDSFLIEMEKGVYEDNDGFAEKNLVLNTLDLFVAGTETTSTTLRWGLIYMIKYPHIQERVQEEINTVIGQSRQPNMADRSNMPYTEAVINEVMRMGNIVPLNALHMAEKDTTLGGYFIPKGTAVLTNLNSVMFDENEWETPNTFNPEHFLDAEGKFVRREALLPFSAGKRVCLGESLARMELFLFFVSLLQRFSFSTLEGVELSLEGKVGVTRVPYPFKIYATSR